MAIDCRVVETSMQAVDEGSALPVTIRRNIPMKRWTEGSRRPAARGMNERALTKQRDYFLEGGIGFFIQWAKSSAMIYPLGPPKSLEGIDCWVVETPQGRKGSAFTNN